MNLRVQAGAVPIVLSVIQNRRYRVGHVHDPSGVAVDDEQESVGRLQDKVFQLLVGEERGLVGAVRARVSGT